MTYQQPPQTSARPTELFAILGIIGAVIFWPAGLILSALALKKIKKTGNGGHGLALAGLIVSIAGAIAWTIAIIVFIVAVVSAQNGLNQAASDLGESPYDYDTSPSSLAVGELGESASGIGVRVDAAECGIASVGTEGGIPGLKTADGQYCTVDMTFINNTDSPIDVDTVYIVGFVGDTEYSKTIDVLPYLPEVEGVEDFGANVAPGAEMKARNYYEIPAGAPLDRLDFGYPFAPDSIPFEVVL